MVCSGGCGATELCPNPLSDPARGGPVVGTTKPPLDKLPRNGNYGRTYSSTMCLAPWDPVTNMSYCGPEVLPTNDHPHSLDFIRSA